MILLNYYCKKQIGRRKWKYISLKEVFNYENDDAVYFINNKPCEYKTFMSLLMYVMDDEEWQVREVKEVM